MDKLILVIADRDLYGENRIIFRREKQQKSYNPTKTSTRRLNVLIRHLVRHNKMTVYPLENSIIGWCGWVRYDRT